MDSADELEDDIVDEQNTTNMKRYSQINIVNVNNNINNITTEYPNINNNSNNITKEYPNMFTEISNSV